MTMLPVTIVDLYRSRFNVLSLWKCNCKILWIVNTIINQSEILIRPSIYVWRNITTLSFDRLALFSVSQSTGDILRKYNNCLTRHFFLFDFKFVDRRILFKCFVHWQYNKVQNGEVLCNLSDAVFSSVLAEAA